MSSSNKHKQKISTGEMSNNDSNETNFSSLTVNYMNKKDSFTQSSFLTSTSYYSSKNNRNFLSSTDNLVPNNETSCSIPTSPLPSSFSSFKISNKSFSQNEHSFSNQPSEGGFRQVLRTSFQTIKNINQTQFKTVDELRKIKRLDIYNFDTTCFLNLQ